jgi:hypothetical protein
MNAIRIGISLFLVVLIALAVAGWLWAGGLPSPKAEGARVALAGCGLAGVVGLVMVWRRRTDTNRAPV